jgi:hypothetical protein
MRTAVPINAVLAGLVKLESFWRNETKYTPVGKLFRFPAAGVSAITKVGEAVVSSWVPV